MHAASLIFTDGFSEYAYRVIRFDENWPNTPNKGISDSAKRGKEKAHATLNFQPKQRDSGFADRWRCPFTKRSSPSPFFGFLVIGHRPQYRIGCTFITIPNYSQMTSAANEREQDRERSVAQHGATWHSMAHHCRAFPFVVAFRWRKISERGHESR